MIEHHNSRALRIIAPTCGVLERETLPPADTTRWVASRKAQVVAAVDGGLLSIDEVLARYRLSLEEFAAWQRAMDRAGVAGLRVAWSQQDRAARRRRRSGAALGLCQA